MKTTILGVLLLLLAPASAIGSVLYKSVGPNGVVEFSDTPPSDRSVLVERRTIGYRGDGAINVASLSTGGGMPVYDDGSLARANAQLDLAEHALAQALRSMGSPLEGLRLSAGRPTSTDLQRIDFFRRNVQLARTNLLEILHSRTTP